MGQKENLDFQRHNSGTNKEFGIKNHIIALKEKIRQIPEGTIFTFYNIGEEHSTRSGTIVGWTQDERIKTDIEGMRMTLNIGPINFCQMTNIATIDKDILIINQPVLDFYMGLNTPKLDQTN